MNAELISADWMPTRENINALPECLRNYIHDLQRKADFLLLIQENAELRNMIADLRQQNNELKRHNAILHNEITMLAA
jgi:hypothetical protein